MERTKYSDRIIKVLIIEDDDEMRSLLKDFIEGEGYEVDSVKNGSEAFRKIVKEPFDFVITDIRMPGLTGLDILRGIKKLQPDTSIIVMTAFGSQDVYRRSLERGATAYLEKPIHLQNLRTLIERIIPLKTKVARR